MSGKPDSERAEREATRPARESRKGPMPTTYFMVEPFCDASAELTKGLGTLLDLDAGLFAVLQRLEYGATKHPDESWKRQAWSEHVARLERHVEALGTPVDPYVSMCRHTFELQPEVVSVRVMGRLVTRDEWEAEKAAQKLRNRKHLAAIVARGLMALTVDAGTSNEDEKQAHPSRGEDKHAASVCQVAQKGNPE